VLAGYDFSLTLDEKREIILLLRKDVSINKLCAISGLPSSSDYYDPRPGEDGPIREALTDWPGSGACAIAAKNQVRSR
jgi:hypothetical protein